MEDIVRAFVSETRKMFDAYKEHLLQLQKQRTLAYDSLTSLDFVCSNWSKQEDVEALVKVRDNISMFLKSLVDDLESVNSIHREIVSRRKRVKEIMAILLDLYRELNVEDNSIIEPLPLEKEIAEELFHSHNTDTMYYNVLDKSTD
jgi:hypothetical protein